MKISSINNTSFNGGFRISNASNKVLEKVEKAGHKVFFNIKDSGDIFFIVDHAKDYATEKLLLSEPNKAKFFFYPQLKPTEETYEKLRGKVLSTRLAPLYNIIFTKQALKENSKYYPKIINLIKNFDPEIKDTNFNLLNNIRIFENPANSTKYMFTEFDKYGFGYLKILPKDISKQGRFFLIKDTPKEIKLLRESVTLKDVMEFNKDFNDNIMHYDNKCFGNKEAQTNFELLLQDLNPKAKEEFINHATKEVPDFTNTICSAPSFFPSKTIRELIKIANSENFKALYIACGNRHFYTKNLKREVAGTWSAEQLRDEAAVFLSK